MRICGEYMLKVEREREVCLSRGKDREQQEREREARGEERRERECARGNSGYWQKQALDLLSPPLLSLFPLTLSIPLAGEKLAACLQLGLCIEFEEKQRKLSGGDVGP